MVDSISKSKEAIGKLFSKRQYSEMVKEIDFGNPKKILDVGGSVGFFSEAVIRKIKNNVDYTIIDINEKSINKGKSGYSKFKFILGNAENMNFNDNEFDLVICKDVLHHCENPEKAVSEIKRVGKRAIIIEARRGDKWLDDYVPEHNHFTLTQFKKLVSPNHISFSNILWPRFRYMPLFLLMPIIPKSNKSFMVGYC